MGHPFDADPEVGLMLRVKADEPGAYEELVRRVAAPLVAFMLRQTGRQEMAEDLAQEVLHRVFRARQSYEPGAKFRTWLYRIATNLGLNRLRYESYRSTVAFSSGDEDDATPGAPEPADPRGGDPAERMLREEQAARVRGAVAQLPANQRMAVTLLRFDELSYVEIADAMDLTVSAVKSLLNRAKENLRRALAGDLGVGVQTGTLTPGRESVS